MKGIEYLEEIVALMNSPLKYPIRITQIFVNLAHCYLSFENMAKVQEMVQKAMKYCFCTDMDHFKMLYPELGKHLP